jgi:hypothetical protein
MTGQEFLKIQDEKIFRPAVMDAIINEFEPPEDSLLITQAFMPMKDVQMDELVALIKAGAFGKTNPVSLGAEHARIHLPTHFYKDMRSGYWRESVMFDEEVLTRLKKPEKPDELWGEALIGEALNVLDIRLNTLVEYLSARTVFDNGYTVARRGVNYTYRAGLPTKFYLDMHASAGSGFKNAPWVASPSDNYLWSNLTNSNPLTDIREGVKKMADYGFQVSEIWMTRKIAGYIEDNTTSNGVRSLIVANPAIAGQMITAELLINAVANLKGITPVVDDRRYIEEVGLVRPLAASGTTLYVGEIDAGMAAAGDIITIRDTNNNYEEEITISSISATDGTITVSTGPTNAYPVGARVTISKKFADDTRVVFRGKSNGRVSHANWISTPSLIKAKDFKNPQPGRYTWTTFNDKVPYFVEVGAGIHGGPMVYAGGGWCILEVA